MNCSVVSLKRNERSIYYPSLFDVHPCPSLTFPNKCFFWIFRTNKQHSIDIITSHNRILKGGWWFPSSSLRLPQSSLGILRVPQLPPPLEHRISFHSDQHGSTCLAAAVRRASTGAVGSLDRALPIIHQNIYITNMLYIYAKQLYICINRQGHFSLLFQLHYNTDPFSSHWSPPRPHPELVWIACHLHWAWYRNVGVLSATNKWRVITV